MLPGVIAELGGRATSFSGDKGTFSAIDPRFSLLVSLDDFTRLYGSLSAINQFLHPYRNSGIFLLYPTVFWYPSSENAQPSTSFQATLGFEKGLRSNEYIVSAESFFRATNNLHEFRFDTVGAPVRDLYSEVLTGTGKAYGVEFLFRKRTGDLTGSVGYTLSWLRETVAELNGGSPFSPPFERRHEIQVALSYAPLERWTFGFLCVLASGQTSLTVPLNSPSPMDFNAGPGVRATQAAQSADFLDLNGGRLPGFQRIELSVIHRFLAWNLPCQVTLRLLNGYGLLDPILWQGQASRDLRYRWSAELQQPNLTPIYPTIGLLVRF